MSGRLVYARRAVKDIEKLDVVTKKRLAQALVRFASDPLHYSKKLTDSDLGDYRFRIGNYRIIFDMKGDEIIILRIGHRRDIYHD